MIYLHIFSGNMIDYVSCFRSFLSGMSAYYLFSLDQLPGMSADRPVPGFLLQEELVAPEDQRGASPCPGDGRRLPPDLFLLWIVSNRPMYPVL